MEMKKVILYKLRSNLAIFYTKNVNKMTTKRDNDSERQVDKTA